MSILVFHFDGVSSPLWSARHEADVDWWRLLAKSMGLSGLVMVDQTEDQKGRHYRHQDEGFTYLYSTSLVEVEDAFPDLDWLYFDEHAVALPGSQVSCAEDFDFRPSADAAAYVFGSDTQGIDMDSKPRHIVSFEVLPVSFAANAAVLALGLRYLQVTS